jgi:hypothetical protein
VANFLDLDHLLSLLLWKNRALYPMDYTNHERRTWIPAYAITIEIVTTLLLAIRLLSRVNKTGGRLGLDDVFITIAWAIATVNIGLIVKCMLLQHFSVSEIY